MTHVLALEPKMALIATVEAVEVPVKLHVFRIRFLVKCKQHQLAQVAEVKVVQSTASVKLASEMALLEKMK